MGDIFNNVVIFLEDNYVYVIGVGLIIILMLIGFLASKRRERKASINSNESMANINDVYTGSINDVADNLQNNNVMQPVDVVAFPEDNDVTSAVNTNNPTTPANTTMTEIGTMPSESTISSPVGFNSPVVEPKVESVAPTVTPVSSESVKPNTTPFSSAFGGIPTPASSNASNGTTGGISTPITGDSRIVQEVKPIDDDYDDQFDKTEIIDLSPIQPEKPTEIKPATNFTPFVIDNSQYGGDDSILNGEGTDDGAPRV